MYQKVLVPVSAKAEGTCASKALTHAMALCSGKIILLHAADPVSQMVGGAARQELKLEEEAEGRALLAQHEERLRKAGMEFSSRIEPGLPVETILRVGHEEKVDLIVMFTDGRDGLEEMVMGSITERVLRNSDMNLLAVRS